MNIYISIILICLALVFKKSKLITILLFILMWTLWGWNSWNGDYDAYSLHFDNIDSYLYSGEYEKGYSYLVYYIKKIVNTYQHFQIVISFFILSTVLYLTLRYSKIPGIYSTIYFVIFIMEFVFIRNYLAHTLILIALILGLESVKNYKLWMFVILIISATIHSSSIIAFTLIIPFYCKLKIWNFKKVTVIFLLYLVFMFLLFNVGLSYLGGSFVGKLAYYHAGIKFSNVFFVHLLTVIVIVMYYHNLLKMKKTEISMKDKRWFILLININIISLAYLAFYMQIPYFGRFLRFLFTFNFLFITYSFHYFIKTKYLYKSKLTMLTMVILVILMFIKSTLNLTLEPLYAMNKIWGESFYNPSSKF